MHEISVCSQGLQISGLAAVFQLHMVKGILQSHADQLVPGTVRLGRQAGTLEPRSWVMVTAKITAEKHPLYKGEVGPVLTALEVTKNAQPADPDVATF